MGLGWGVGGNKKTRGIYLPTYLPTRRVGLSAVVGGKKKKKGPLWVATCPCIFNISTVCR